MMERRIPFLLLIAAWLPAYGQPPPAESAIDQQRRSVALMKAAMEKQRAAIAATMAAVARQRQQSAGHTVAPPLAAAAPPDLPLAPSWTPAPPCDPMPEMALAPIIENAARTENLPTGLLRAVIAQESGSRPCAVSTKGAQGLMQLMPATAEQLRVRNPFDPTENVGAGAKFLRQLLNLYREDLPSALGAYNAGPSRVPAIGALPDFPETKSYIERILSRMAGVE